MPNVLFTNVRIIDGSGAPPYSGEVLVQGNRIARVAKGVRSIPTAGITVIDAAGATLDARHDRGAHAFRLERPAGPQRDPAHAARGAHPVVRPHRRALSRDGLDLLRRRRARQAAPRRGDPQRDRVGPDQGPALSRRQPGDHGARRAGRRDPAASAVPRIQLRRGRERRRGDARRGAPVPQVRRRRHQAQPVGRVYRRHSGRVHADDGCRGGGRGLGGQAARQARPGACALLQVDQAVPASRHRGDLPRELHRRRGARHARSRQGPHLRGAWPRLAGQDLVPREPNGA